MVNVVDLGLMDGSGRFLGWSGSARSSVCVGRHSSTSGYLMTDIEPGAWSIIVGAYKIPDRGLDVRYEIEYTPNAARWFTGDLHMHSDASDGQHNIAILAKKAKDKGLDFIAVADHNNYAENLHPLVVPGLTLLPAVEWTHYLGHMNFFGVDAPFDRSFIANSEDEMLELVSHARAKGALVSVNHPKCGLCPYLWESESSFDLIEVWNGPMRGANIDAIAWWRGLLQSGRKVPLVGGSDYHRDFRPVRFARPVTRVFAQSQSIGGLLEAISLGHCYVSSSANGVGLDLRCGDAMMGDAVTMRDGLELSISASRLRPGLFLRLETSDGSAAEWKSIKNGNLPATVPVTQSWRFAYLVVVRQFFAREVIRAISNPIYFERQ